MTREQKTAARKMWEDGETAQAVADRFEVSRNTVVGLVDRGNWTRQKPRTLFDRCAALHARLDAVLSETVGIGRIPNEPERP